MSRLMGAAFAVFAVASCGHAITTGSAQNNWTTPTGYASATNPRVVDPNGGTQRARDRSVFAQREAPTLQPQPADTSSVDTMPPPAPELPPPDTTGRSVDELPPYVSPTGP